MYLRRFLAIKEPETNNNLRSLAQSHNEHCNTFSKYMRNKNVLMSLKANWTEAFKINIAASH